MQLLPMASSPDGLISARDAVITKTPGWGRGAAIGQVWNRHFRSRRACPTAFLCNQFSSSGLWPVACLHCPSVPVPASWLGSGLWDQGFGFRALSPGVTPPLESGGSGRGVHSLFHVWVTALGEGGGGRGHSLVGDLKKDVGKKKRAGTP